MIVEKTKRVGLWCWKATCFSLALLVGIALGLYLSRVEIAELAAKKTLDSYGFQGVQLQWNRLDRDQLEIRGIALSNEDLSLEIDELELTYNIGDVWADRELRDLRVKGLRLVYDLTGPSTFDYDELDALLRRGAPFPMNWISVEDAELEFATDWGTLVHKGGLSLARTGLSRLSADVYLQSESEILELKIELADRLEFTARMAAPDAERFLSVRVPSWTEAMQLPEASELDLSDFAVDVSGSFHGIEPESIRVSMRTGPIFYEDTATEMAFGPIDTAFDVVDREIRNLELSTTIDRFAANGIETIGVPLILAAESLERPMISIGNSEWIAPNDSRATLSADLRPSLDENFGIDEIAFDVAVQSMSGPDIVMDPFQIRGKGTLDAATIQCSDLSSSSHPWVRLEDLDIQAADLLSGNPLVNLTANLRSGPEQGATDFGAWLIEAVVNPLGDPISLSASLSPVDSAIDIAAFGVSVQGSSAKTSVDLDYWTDLNAIEASLEFGGSGLDFAFDDWSMSDANATVSIDSEQIEFNDFMVAKESPFRLAEFLSRRMDYKVSLEGSQLEGPNGSRFSWYSSQIQPAQGAADSLLAIDLAFNAGIVALPPEEAQQIALRARVEGDARAISVATSASLLFEGSEVAIESNQTFEGFEGDVYSKGNYTITGMEFASSDLLARHTEGMEDAIVSGAIDVAGDIQLSDGDWDASARVKLHNGRIELPSQELEVDRIDADIQFQSLASPATSPSQTLRAGSVTFGDLQATDFGSVFSLPEMNRLTVEAAWLETFDGRLALEPFDLDLDRFDADLLIRFEEISLAPAVAKIDFFQGKVAGRLNGRLPIRLQNGQPAFGEGFLELDPGYAATFSYNAEGFFAGEDDAQPVRKSLGDKTLERLGLEPNALLEDALGDLDITKLRVDLFNRDTPLTPMRIQLSGVADTEKARIPLHITTNINGTVEELLNFLMRLDSLGVAAAGRPRSSQAASF